MISDASQKSLLSVASGGSDLSLFEQHLPQEPQRFKVALNARRTAASKSTRRGTYDFTVLPALTRPRSREPSPTGAGDNSPLQTWLENEDAEMMQDEHYMFLTGRTFFRHQRHSRFAAGRQFPALTNPRILPSFKRATDMSKKLEEIEEAVMLTPVPPPKRAKAFVKTTVSAVRQRQVRHKIHKKTPGSSTTLPFIPSGVRQKAIPACRRPGGVQGEYDRAREAHIEDSQRARSQRLYGAFIPGCAKPKPSSLGPLTFSRSQLAAIAPSFMQPLPNVRLSRALTLGREDADGEADAELDEHGSPLPSSRSPSGTKSPALRSPSQSPRGSYARKKSEKWSEQKLLKKREPKEKEEPLIPIFSSEIDVETMYYQVTDLDKKKDKAVAMEKAHFGVFKKLADEGKVHLDDIPRALVSAGFARPNSVWINESFKKVTKYVSVSFEDFLRFLTGYETCQTNYYKAEFDKCDADGSGSVEASELLELMKSLGIEPMKHVLEKVIEEVDDNGNGELDFAEFEKVMDILRMHEGFVKEEYEEIKELFQRFDRDRSGTMDTKEAHMAMQWLGFVVREEVADRIISEVDEDQSGQIDATEWIVCMRKVREHKIKELKDVMLATDVDHDGTIQYSELQSLLRVLGYVPDFDAVFEAAADANIAPDDNELDLGELWRLLAVYRDREGLNQEDLYQVETSFDKYCNKDGEVEVVDIGKMVRAIGYVVDFDVSQNLTNKVDIDGSGKLDKREFRKMVRMIHEADIELFRLAFQEGALTANHSHQRFNKSNHHTEEDHHAGKSLSRRPRKAMTGGAVPVGHTPHISVEQALKGLERLSCNDTPEVLMSFFSKDAVEDGKIDFYEFVQAAIRSRRMFRAAFRENGGFTKEQIQELKVSFDKYDTDHSGEISGVETVQLFEGEFPDIANDHARRPQLIQLLKDADEDESGSLDFKDFLRIMRQLRDMQDKLRIEKEIEAVSETKFTPPEVQEFRELFIAAGEGAQELGFEEVRDLLKCIVPMGTKNNEDLREKFDEMAAKQMGAPGDVCLLDFPEFLWLMRELLSINFANMAERAETMVKTNSLKVSEHTSQGSEPYRFSELRLSLTRGSERESGMGPMKSEHYREGQNCRASVDSSMSCGQ